MTNLEKYWIDKHLVDVKKVLEEHDFPMDKIEFSTEAKKYALLHINEIKHMENFRSRVLKAKKTIMFVDTCYPSIKGKIEYPITKENYFEIIKVILVQ